MMIKVLNVTEEGRGGGPHGRIAQVAHFLRGKGVETIISFPKNGSEHFQKELNQLGLKYYPISLHRITRNKIELLYYFLFFFSDIWNLTRVIRKENIDVIHVNGAYQYKAAIAGFICKTRVIWHLNDMYQPRLIRFVFRILSQKVAHGFIFASKKTREYYWENFMSKRATIDIPAPVDLKKFKGDLQKVQRVNLGRDDRIKIASVGYFNPDKDFETLVNVASKVVQEYPNGDFLIVGKVYHNQEAYFRSVKKRVDELNLSKNIHFLGHQSDVAQILKECHFYLCTSQREASPMAVWEALAMGMPIVSTDVGDVKLVFEKYKTGSIANIKDHNGLAAILIGLIRDPGLTMNYKKNSLNAINEFDISTIASKHLDIYTTVALRCLG